jgi:hypothetical protein
LPAIFIFTSEECWIVLRLGVYAPDIHTCELPPEHQARMLWAAKKR